MKKDLYMKKMENTVLAYPKLLAHIDASSSGSEDRVQAINCLKEIRAEYSKSAIKKIEKLMDASLNRLYDGISLNENNVNIKELLKTKNLVLVPNHQSHADYLVINYKFYKTYNRPVYVAGGDNLNIFPIGKLFRKSGCFFIRRTFSSDTLYKLTLEAYLYWLLLEGTPIEFFFEGGRSRTGKLRSPKFGLYHMILEAHNAIPKEKQRELLFVPLSIMHEYVPEQKALSKELDGGKKVKESTGQLLNVFKVFGKNFGTVHLNCGKPVVAKDEFLTNPRNYVHDLAFECFRTVASNMMVTPISLLSLILLDSPSGSFVWEDCLKRAELIRTYCLNFDVPMTQSLTSKHYDRALKKTLKLLIRNKMVQTVGSRKTGSSFYLLKEEARPNLLYFKNTIVHHFLVPWSINFAWINLFNGSIKTVDDLKNLLLTHRNLIKHEFYLPTVKKYMVKALKVISYAVGYEVRNLSAFVSMNPKDLYAIASNVGVFSQMLGYINAGYFIADQALQSFSQNDQLEFTLEEYKKSYLDVYEHEISLGQMVRYPESHSNDLIISTLKYFTHQKFITLTENENYQISDRQKCLDLTSSFKKVLEDQLSFNIRV